MAMAMVDTAYLSTYLDVPEPSLTTLIDAPTAELVASILNAVIVKAHQHEELRADKLRTDIELESVVRTAETRSQGFKATVDKALKDVEDIRGKLKEEGKNEESILHLKIANLQTYRE